jgi:hypothetical protein
MFAFRLSLALALGVLFTGVASAADLKFEIYKDKSEEFRWRLKDGDTILGTGGEGYKSKADCKKGVEKIQKDANTDAVSFEVYEDNAKKFRWRAKVKNGNIIASSSGAYDKKDECEKTVKTIQTGAAKAKVEEIEEKKDK